MYIMRETSYGDFENGMGIFVQESDEECFKLCKCVDDNIGV